MRVLRVFVTIKSYLRSAGRGIRNRICDLDNEEYGDRIVVIEAINKRYVLRDCYAIDQIYERLKIRYVRRVRSATRWFDPCRSTRFSKIPVNPKFHIYFLSQE